MRFIKDDPQLGELEVTTENKAEALRLRSHGYRQVDEQVPAAEQPAPRKTRAPRAEDPGADAPAAS